MPRLTPVPYQKLVKVFEKDGFTFSRQATTAFTPKPGIKRPLVIAEYKAVPVFIIKNLLRTAGMSRERYIKLLDDP